MSDNNNNNPRTTPQPPTTVLIVLGDALHFEPSGEAEVLSVKVHSPEELTPSLEAAKKRIQPASLDNVHVIIKASSIGFMYKDIVVSTFVDALRPNAELTVHALASDYGAAAPIEFDDVSEIRTSLVLSGLALESEGRVGGDVGWTLTARKEAES